MAGNGNSSVGANTAGFAVPDSSASTQMPSTLGGLNSTSNLTGTGTAADNGYTPSSGTSFTMPTTAAMSAAQLAALQSGLAGGSKIAASGATGSNGMSSAPRLKSTISLPAQTFSSGIPNSTVDSGSTGVTSLLSLMQQLKS